MFKATLTFALLFLAVAGSAQGDGGADSSAQPPSNLSSMTSQVYPTGTPVSEPPTASDGNSSQMNRTRPSGGCHPHSMGSTVQPPPSSVFSSVASDATGSPDVKMNFTCHPEYESTIPTGTASVPPLSGGAFPTSNVSKPMGPHGTYSGNVTQVPTASGPDEQAPPTGTPTTTFGKLDCL